MSSDEAMIQTLRSDVALQVARGVRRFGGTQVEAARRLGIPQPTLSKIMNGRVHDLSIELLLRVAKRVGLALTLQTGGDAAEAGAFVSGMRRASALPRGSRLATEARQLRQASDLRMSATERLEAFLQHNELLEELHRAGRAAELLRAQPASDV